MINETSIVLVGGFNPLIFHPTWFEKHKILPIQETDWAIKGENESATIEGPNGLKLCVSESPTVIVNNQRSEVNFLSVRISVTAERFIMHARDENNFSLAKETILKIINTLPHTPVTACGINFNGIGVYNNDAPKILNSIFVSDSDTFKNIFGDQYTTSGIVTFETNDAKVRFIFEKMMNDDTKIMYNANYHRDVTSALEAADLISKFFKDDLSNAKYIIKSVLGREERNEHA